MCMKITNFDIWQKNKFKFKSKTQNKTTKIITQKLKPKIWSVQNQNTNLSYCNEIKNVHTKITKQGYGEILYLRLVLNILKIMGSYIYLYPFGDLVQESFHEGSICPPTKKTLKKVS
jgi:hypothetical protein